LRKLVAAPYLAPNDWTPRSEAYFVFPLAQGTPGKQCGLAAAGDYQPSLRSPWLAADVSQIHPLFDSCSRARTTAAIRSASIGCRPRSNVAGYFARWHVPTSLVRHYLSFSLWD
ncbi:hypothetical protein, partial [Thiolapillus sp.]|uniref:hypothetical protein n=1 Tax=Thiolapillus sp. TaxID=2017437 RepID=UPI003AF7C9E7